MAFAVTRPTRINRALLLKSLLVVLLLMSCNFLSSAGPSSTNTPEEMFEALIQSPVPADISHLEGTGDTWQGHSIYLRFQAEPAFLNSYLNDQFELMPCEKVLSSLKLPHSDYDVFNPPWKPEDVVGGKCYRSKGFAGETWLGEQFILWDSQTNTVYFYSVGG